MLGGVAGVAHLITGHEQNQLNRVCLNSRTFLSLRNDCEPGPGIELYMNSSVFKGNQISLAKFSPLFDL